MKKEILDQINNIINYQPASRIKLDIYLKKIGDNQENYLLVDNDLTLKTKDVKVKLNFDDIKEIKLSMCSRLYNPGVVESGPVKLLVKRWQHGAPLTVGQHVNYYLDLDIVLVDIVIKLENNNLYHSLALIDYLEAQGIVVNDPLGIKAILKKYPDGVDLVRYLNNNFPKLAKKYDLDNPRGIEFIK